MASISKQAENTIVLRVNPDGWQAIFGGPHAESVFNSFGAFEIPTPFPAHEPATSVLQSIRALNPGVVVSLDGVA